MVILSIPGLMSGPGQRFHTTVFPKLRLTLNSMVMSGGVLTLVHSK